MRNDSILVYPLVGFLLAAAAVSASDAGGVLDPSSLVPLTELESSLYRGFSGGLYPEGSNRMPADHAGAGISFASLVRPLDAEGDFDPGGKIVLVSIGMSNTTQEFCGRDSSTSCTSFSFVGQAKSDPAVDQHTLVLANGALGGQTAATWDSPREANYDRIRDRVLAPMGLSEAQVQVGWVKVANSGPTVRLPDPNADAVLLVRQMGDIVRSMKIRYPNLRLVYLSSRIYAGYATTLLNPEPYAYESGFAVKWLIEAQIRQTRSGHVDPTAGDLAAGSAAPWIAWGPYLWAAGTSPRSDGLVWLPADFQNDGTHPSSVGQEKVGSLLLSFFKNEPTARTWFLADSGAPARRRAVRRD